MVNHPKCFSLILMVKDIFLHNGGQHNVFAFITHSNRSIYFFHLLKGPDPSYLVFKFSNILPINNWDMTKYVISQRSWPSKVKVIGQNKWHQLKGLYSTYLMLKFGNVLPIRNWEIARNVILQRSWPWKVKVIGKINGTIGFLDLKNIDLDTKIVILSVLVQKLWSKTSFCIMVANVARSRTSHVQIAQDIFLFIERPRPKLSYVKI